MDSLTDQDHAAFAEWFAENYEVPEGVDAFETMDDGITYAWKNTREGLAIWVDLSCSKALVEAGVTQVARFRMPMHWILAEDGKTPVQTDDIMAWGNCMANEKLRRVGFDYDNDKGVTISTVFLGIDHNFMGGRPVLFETMLFRHAGGEHPQQRYCTWEDAELGHQVACDALGIKRRLSNWIEGELANDQPE